MSLTAVTLFFNALPSVPDDCRNVHTGGIEARTSIPIAFAQFSGFVVLCYLG